MNLAANLLGAALKDPQRAGKSIGVIFNIGLPVIAILAFAFTFITYNPRVMPVLGYSFSDSVGFVRTNIDVPSFRYVYLRQGQNVVFNYTDAGSRSVYVGIQPTVCPFPFCPTILNLATMNKRQWHHVQANGTGSFKVPVKETGMHYIAIPRNHERAHRSSRRGMSYKLSWRVE